MSETEKLPVKKIDCRQIPGCGEVPFILDAEGIDFQPVSCVDWPDRFPCRPEVSFRMAHTGAAILLQFKVAENDIAALRDRDNTEVWKDTCVEFFVSPDCNDTYYNIECNGIGSIWFAGGKAGERRTVAEPGTVGMILRLSSLGTEPFAMKKGPCTWTVVEIIPAGAFFLHRIKSFDGLQMKGNFYKCGDGLPEPHYLSWKPIRTPDPNFHCPSFFGDISFE